MPETVPCVDEEARAAGSIARAVLVTQQQMTIARFVPIPPACVSAQIAANSRQDNGARTNVHSRHQAGYRPSLRNAAVSQRARRATARVSASALCEKRGRSGCLRREAHRHHVRVSSEIRPRAAIVPLRGRPAVGVYAFRVSSSKFRLTPPVIPRLSSCPDRLLRLAKPTPPATQ